VKRYRVSIDPDLERDFETGLHSNLRANQARASKRGTEVDFGPATYWYLRVKRSHGQKVSKSVSGLHR